MQLKVHCGALHMQGRYEGQEGMPPMQELDPPCRCYLVEYPGGLTKLFFSIPGSSGAGSVFQSSEMKEDRPANGERFFNDDFSNDPGSCSSTVTLTPQVHPSGNAFMYRQRFDGWIGVFIGGMLPVEPGRNSELVPQGWMQHFEQHAPSVVERSAQQAGNAVCNLGSIAQMCLAADYFFMQATLNMESKDEDGWLLNYQFPEPCFDLVVGHILRNPEDFGLQKFEGVAFSKLPNSTQIRVEFPNETEQDKLHSFFSAVNAQRKAFQGMDASYPPMPDLYQGEPKLRLMIALDYMKSIEDAFNGTDEQVQIPIANGKFYPFK
jgi:hypothetical protein